MSSLRESILVVGGYGAVGKVVATTLAPLFPGRVVVAGRDLRQAQALAQSMPQALSALQLNVEKDEDVQRALKNVRVVVMCVERSNFQFARSCLAQGIHYVEISATAPILAAIGSLQNLAVERSATVALSVGLAPGLTNLLARHSIEHLPSASRVDIAIMGGLGEHHGAQAVRWTVDNFATPVDRTDAAPVAALVNLPGFGFRRAHRFPFSDQYTLQETLRLPVVTRLCFDSVPMTGFLFALRAMGFFSLMRWLKAESLLAWFFFHLHFGTDQFVVQATASDEKGARVSCSATGRLEARATGIIAALVARDLYTEAKRPGVFQIDQLINPSSFFDELEKNHPFTFHRA